MDYRGFPGRSVHRRRADAVPLLLQARRVRPRSRWGHRARASDAAIAANRGDAPAEIARAKFIPRKHEFVATPGENGRLTTEDIAVELRRVPGERSISFSHLPLSWNGASWPFRHPLDFLGSDGGGGIGAGPGIAVGAALALEGSGDCRWRCAETAIS
jgi:thiamine pyrophosphate-dependent acetolactate synthase large subunit-like protein